MDVLIETTSSFEKDLHRLGEKKKALLIQEINDFPALFLMDKADFYNRLHQLPLPLPLKDYDSSLYFSQLAHDLTVILAIDEDPLFEQAIFTLFRVVEGDNLDKAYQKIAEVLYQEIVKYEPEIVKVA